MDRATTAYGLPPPQDWSYALPIPAPHFRSWLRIGLAPPRDTEVTRRVVVERHDWSEEAPDVNSVGWYAVPAHGFEPRFNYKAEAIAWIMGLLYGAAWCHEFAADRRCDDRCHPSPPRR